jgi:hypothetical protein
MNGNEDGQAVQRLPVQNKSQSASCQPRLGNRLAHVQRQVRTRVRSAVSAAAQRSVSGPMAVLAAVPAVIPARINLVVALGLVLGGYAIVRRRMIVGLVLILLALAIAGGVALAHEGSAVLHPQSGPFVSLR